MRLPRVPSVALLAASVLFTGCATQQPGQPDAIARYDILGQVTQGQMRLGCGLACAASWRQARPTLAGLARNALWADLAVDVARIGYTLDLGYLYLARAAEGLGHPAAAITYYRLALASPSVCDGMVFDSCDGSQVPEEARTALDRLAGKRPAAAAAVPTPTPTPAPVPEPP